MTAWGILWRSRSQPEHLVCRGSTPVLFPTRAQAGAWINRHYGYIRHRPDLRAAPHEWRMPRPVRVTIEIEDRYAVGGRVPRTITAAAAAREINSPSVPPPSPVPSGG